MALPVTLLLVGVIVLATLFLAAARIAERAATRAGLEQVALLVRIHDLVHRLQVERGLSVGALAAATDSRSELVAARRRTDDEAAAMAALPVVAADDGASDPGVRDANEALQPLAGLRARIDTPGFPTASAFAEHSAMIERLLAIGDRQVRRIDNIQLQSDGSALSSFARAKEAAGRERAILNAAFISRRLTREQADELRALVAVQETYLARFESLAGSRTIGVWLAGREEAFRETDRLREAAIAGRGESLRMTSGYWFAAATAKIDWMKIIEDLMTREIEHRAQEHAARTQAELFRIIGFGLLTAAATLLLLAAPFGWPARTDAPPQS
jgi:methyl-accepting chemotaxis protein